MSEKTKELLLVVANASTPYKMPRGIQVYRLLLELCNYFEIILITSENSLAKKNADFFQNKLREVFVVKESAYLLSNILKRFWGFFAIVDIVFAYRSYHLSRKVIDKYKIKKILCMSLRNTIAGYYLKRHYNGELKVFTFFSDPIADNPYITTSFLSNKLIQKIEKDLLTYIDVSIFPSGSMVDFYKKKHPHISERIKYIPHSFVSLQKGIFYHKSDNDIFTIRHIGSLNELRNPFDLFNYIKIHDPDFLLKHNICFEFYGRYSRTITDSINNYESSHIKFYDEVKYSEAEILHQTSNALIVIDANITPSFFLPSKLIEILPYYKPIIILTTEDSESSAIGKLINQEVLFYNNIKEIISILQRIKLPSKNSSDISAFEITNVAKRYYDCIKAG